MSLSVVSSISRVSKNSSWSFLKLKSKVEPFNDIPLTECTLSIIEEKIEFLKENNLLLMSECDAIEMYVIKLQPEFFDRIDVSWMPFDFSNEKRVQLNVVIPKVVKESKRTLASTVSSRTHTSSVFSAFKYANPLNKISINHLIYEIEKVVMVMDVDFNKEYQRIVEQNERIKNEMENIEIEYLKIIQSAESFRSEVLVSGYNQLTKRIPSEVYERYVKKRYSSNEHLMSYIRLKIVDAIVKQKFLNEKFIKLDDLHGRITETDCMQVVMVNKKHNKELSQKLQLNKKMKAYKNKVRQDYQIKTRNMEKFELGVDSNLMGTEIKRFEKKLLQTPFVEKLTTESVNELHNPTSKESVDNIIDNYMKVKHYIEWNDKYIKAMERRINEKCKIVRLQCQKLKNYLMSTKNKNRER